MVNIGSILNRELANKETFYLPGLGMFKKEYIPAYFDETKQLFIPPSQAFHFIDQEFDQDKLTEFIAGNQDLTLAESKKASSLIVNTLVDCLAKKEDVYIEDHGTYSVTQHDELIFVAEDSKSQFSLYDPIAEAEELPARETELEVAEQDALVSNPDELTEHTHENLGGALIEPVLDNELNDLEQEGDSKRWLWPVIGVAICVIIAGVWFLTPIQDRTNGSTNSNQQTQQTETDADSIALAAGGDQTTETTTTRAANVTDSSASVIRKPTDRYEIIIAAFETITEAEDFVAKTNAKGYNVYILQNNRAGNMNKVSYASFNTAADASESLSRVRKELASEAWLWENKNYNK